MKTRSQIQSKAASAPLPSSMPIQAGGLQRKCACGGSSGVVSECTECRSQRQVRRGSGIRQPTPTAALSIVHEALRSPSQPLDPATRAFMEPRFGHDFSQVRVHTNAQATKSARSINALAYTVGRDIVFGSQQYQPETREGRRLLAHELTHVAQQNHSAHSLNVNRYEDAHSPAEREADVISDRVASEKSAGPLSNTAIGSIQFQADAGVPNRGLQLECVKRLGGCPETRPAGIPTPEEIADYNQECRKETDYTGPDVSPTGEECQSAEKKEDKPAALPESEADKKKTPETAAAEKGGKKCCLTYDDGPQKGTEDVLDAHGGSIPATFFLTGKNMKGDLATQKKLVERMLNEGHKIGNHTFTHDPMTAKEYEKAYGDLSDPAKLKKFQENYEKNEQHFQKLLGAKSPVFKLARLPGNGRFVKVGGKLIFVAATEDMGMAHVTWHFEFGTNGSFGHLKTLDWKGIKGVASEHDKFPKSNDIILLHDRHWAGKKSLLKDIFSKLTGEGFTFGQLNDSGKCA